MKLFLSTLLMSLSLNALAGDSLSIFKLPSASDYRLETLKTEYFVVGSEVFVSVEIRTKFVVRGHPEMSLESYLVKIPELAFCAYVEDSKIVETQNCKLEVEVNAQDEIEVSIALNN